ncbi:MAG: DUF6152 family protein [Gammaproteobacteria bacterium]|nr:DUF6152 family protein [Gammaproteobacteria bacterium]
MKLFVTIILTVLALPLFAHHSFFGRFDNSTSMEMEGTVTEIHWRNPHVHIFLEVENPDGSMTKWDLESGSPTLMQRAGIPRDAIEEGMTIRVAAWPSLTENLEAFATNVLLPDGRELVMQTGADAKFNDQFTGDFSYRFRTEGDRSNPELGLFRMWTFTGSDGFLFPESINRNYDLNTYPMTDAAREVLAGFNLATDNPTNNCNPKGMPLIMEQPLPMEILQDGETVVLRIEEYDLTRTIHMDQQTAPVGTPFTLLGYSVGWWENDTLVTRTTHLSFPWFNQRGMPLSTAAGISERFTPIEDGSMMDYQMTVTDAVNFYEPVHLSKKWIHVPGVEILPFECEEYAGEV